MFQLRFEEGGPRASSHPETVEGVVESNFRPYPEVYKSQHGFPEELNNVNPTVLFVPIWKYN